MNSSNQNDCDAILDWEEIHCQIPGSEDPQGPIQLIKTCFSNENDPYDQIDKRLDLFIENLQKRLQEMVK